MNILSIKTLKVQIKISVFLLWLIPGFTAAQQAIPVGFLGSGKAGELKTECRAAFEFLNASAEIKPGYLSLKQACRISEISKYPVIWYHRPDSSGLSSAETDPKFIESLKNYVQAGGNLLLSLDALRLLPLLGLEKTSPGARYVQAVDEGFGRKLGLHSFLQHPVFDSLNGGAYLFAPAADQPVRQMGWFGNTFPEGKTVAVDWAYITLIEDSKLLTEYTLGKGKVLAVGSYMFFEPSNFSRPHLELFTKNCLRYLAGKSNTQPRYWDYEPNLVLPFVSPADSVPLLRATPWIPGSELITLRKKYSGNNLWDLAGEKGLIMGKEKGGIDEIWAHPFMALRDYQVGIWFAGSDSIYWLNSQQPEIEVRPESFTRIYRFRRAYLTEIISGHPTEASAVVHYELRSLSPAKLIVKLKSNLRLMWPYSERVTGQLHFDWNEGLNSFIFSNKIGSAVTITGSNRKPLQHKAGQYDDFEKVLIPPNVDRMVRGDSLFYGLPTTRFQVAALMVFELEANDNLDIVVSASASGLKKAVEQYKMAVKNPISVYLNSLHYNNGLFDRKLSFYTPEKSFNEGFRWAIVGTDRFFVNCPGIGRSLVAGYSTTDFGWDGGQKVNGRPGYAWYFGRDGVWSSFAVLGYGDFDKVRSVLDLYAKFQDISGKIYHELTTSGVAHYDAADATPLYIALAGRYLHHSGDTAYIRQQWPAIQKALNYCYSTDTDGDHLIENSLAGHGWEEGGSLFGTHTTFYLASCWAEALEQAAYMAKVLKFTGESQKYAADWGKVLKIMNNEFWNPSASYFYHGKYKDGTYHPEPDVMAAVPLLFHQVNDTAKWAPVLGRLASCNFSTDWGVRILGENSKFFRPGSYHQGSVWPLFTGWTSLAEYAYGKSTEGYEHLMNNLLTYRSWSQGFVPEVLHGTEYKPFGVCAHQCWSETMVLEPAIEGMLGLQPDATENLLTLCPRFPRDWDTVSVQNIRMDNRLISMTFSQTNEKSTWIFHKSGGKNDMQLRLNLAFPPGTRIQRVRVNGREAETELQDSRLGMNLVLKEDTKVEIFRNGGICTLPETREVKPGSASAGCRILSEKLLGKEFLVQVDGKSGSEGRIRIFCTDATPGFPANCRLLFRDGNVYCFSFQFPASESTYVSLPLSFTIN